MPKRTSKTGSELFIVDNSDKDWKVLGYLHDWCQLSKALDVATGFFEIGSLLALNEEWQKVDQIRILMGNEVSLRTKAMFAEGLRKIKTRLDESLNAEKQTNDFLSGVPAIVEAVRSGKIKYKVYREDKFHAKAYITHARLEVVGSAALVGSSNFTYHGLTENIELNVQITGRPVNVLQEWFEEHWKKAEDVTEEILSVIERHSKEYLPFDVYARSLHELFRRHAMTDQEWLTAGTENGGSRVYPVLDQYQKDGYHELAEIVDKYNGGFLCDGVGLGKTYIGLMLIENLIVRHRKRVVLFVPKSARESVWENNIRKYLPSLSGPWGNNLMILNHTDLLREKLHREIEAVKEADAIVIDEAHHFRNPGTKEKSRYWRLFEVTEDKELFLLTATPVNNRLIDLQHMIELFSRRQSDYFKDAPLGVHSLPGHFRKMEKALEKLVLGKDDGDYSMETNQAEADKVLLNDTLFRALVVQRSRAYVKKSQQQHGGVQTQFPDREPPRVINHSIKKTYGRLLEMMEQAFSKEKPLFSLAMYYPLAYYKGSDTSIDPLVEGRQKEVVSLIRTQFLKRFESSVRAFEMSCMTMMIKLLTWVTKHCQTGSSRKCMQGFGQR